MEKEVETASKMVNPELSGGSHSYKEAVYNVLGNFRLAFYSSRPCANYNFNRFGNNDLAYFESQKIS